MANKQSEASKKYDQANTKMYSLKANKNYDALIIDKLDSLDNRQAYLKDLIKKDIYEQLEDKDMYVFDKLNDNDYFKKMFAEVRNAQSQVKQVFKNCKDINDFMNQFNESSNDIYTLVDGEYDEYNRDADIHAKNPDDEQVTLRAVMQVEIAINVYVVVYGYQTMSDWDEDYQCYQESYFSNEYAISVGDPIQKRCI